MLVVTQFGVPEITVTLFIITLFWFLVYRRKAK